MIPAYFKTESFQEPSDPLFYLIASNGSFLVRKAGLFSSITAASGMPGLQPQKPQLSLQFGKIPRGIMERIFGFFDWAYREFESEAIVLLYYDPARRSFHAEAPQQTIYRYRSGGKWHTEGRVEYDSLTRPAHVLKLGDIHSHGDLRAFFSATDDADDHEDGLRIVMGNLHRAAPEVCVSFIASGVRFMLEPDRVMEDFSRPAPPPPEWTRRLSCVDDAGHGLPMVARRKEP